MEHKFLVIKDDDIEEYLDSAQISMLTALAERVERGRKADDKLIKEYLVLDLDASIALNSLNVDISNRRMSGSINVQVRDISGFLLEAMEKKGLNKDNTEEVID